MEATGKKKEKPKKDEKKDNGGLKKFWDKFSLAILFAAFSIPMAILAYILIVFFLT